VVKDGVWGTLASLDIREASKRDCDVDIAAGEKKSRGLREEEGIVVMLEHVLSELRDAQDKAVKLLRDARRVRREDEDVVDALRRCRRKLGGIK
jgi:hypothetical protein